MKLVETVLLENIDNPNACFVFPTDTAVSRWADHVLRLKSEKEAFSSVAMNKFLAWDVFKQKSIKSKVLNKKSIPSALRKIFISRLLRENAECAQKGQPVFTSLVRQQWALSASRFTPWLTRLLPQLSAWFNKTTGLTIQNAFGEETDKTVSMFLSKLEGDDLDLFTLALRYSQFLEEHSLFEPAWETPPFNNDGLDCFIFFPEALSDYSEYKDLLETSRHVKIIRAQDADKLPCDSFFYTNSRSEITEAALYIRALRENSGIAWDSIVVCIADSDSYEAYILREFTNRNIPYVKRASKPLTDYPAGRFFQSILDCLSRDFAFSSLCALVLNSNLPWKEKETINSLIEFGINNNCICSWTEEGKTLNVWEDAFQKPYKGAVPRVRQFFFDLKNRLLSLREASTFSQLRVQYFIFRDLFFDMEQCSGETDLILSRCISELMYLVELEKDFPSVPCVDPFSFFCEYLTEVNYLPQTQTTGVNIIPYKTAASSPFDCHIILGSSQDSLSVVYSRLDFLPRKKREALNLFDEDASSAFIDLHKYNSLKHCAFFCSEQTFSGYAIPHTKTLCPPKPKARYAGEAEHKDRFSKDYYLAASSSDKTNFYALHDVQINGFEKWKNRRRKEEKGGKWQTGKALLDLINKKLIWKEKYPKKIAVSSSALSPYYQCSLKWLFERVLKLRNEQIQTNLMPENIAGILFHECLKIFFSEIKERNEVLEKPLCSETDAALPPSYKNLLRESIDRLFDNFPAFVPQGSLQMSSLTKRLLDAGKNHYLFLLENCLVSFLSYFSGCRVAGCEASYDLERDLYFLDGKLDCLLEDVSQKEKKYIIVDFKTKWMPKREDCDARGEYGLRDFQLPVYITLVEENEKTKVQTALFYSIIDLKPEVIIGSIQDMDLKVIPKKAENIISRESEECKKILEEFNTKALRFAKEVSTGDFSVFETDYKNCLSCEYRRVCRTVYTIKREKNINLGKD
jgi:hypothetical protein